MTNSRAITGLTGTSEAHGGSALAPLRPVVMLPVATGVFMLLLAVAAVVRLTNLGAVPLAPAEAREALSAWQLWRGWLEPPLRPASPGYFVLTGSLMGLLGDSDAVARLLPALAGIALVALPWLVRRQMTVPGALVASAILASSGLNTSLARTAGGASIALFAGMLLAVSLIRYQDSGEKFWFLTACAAAGLGLASAPVFLTIVFSLILAWAALVILGQVTVQAFRPASDMVRRGALTGAGVFLALTLALGWHPAGLGSAGNLVAIWLRGFGLPTDAGTWSGPFLALARYETALLILGFLAVVWSGWQGTRMDSVLAYWLVAGLLVIVIQPGVRENAAVLALPASLLVGRLVTGVMLEQSQGASRWQRWFIAAAFVFLAATVLASAARHVKVSATDPLDQQYLLLAAIVTILGLGAAAFLWIYDRVLARQGLLMAALALLVYVNCGSSWWLGHQGAMDTRSVWVTEAADDEAPLLDEAVREITRATTRSEVGLMLWSTVDSPLLRWAFRDFPEIRFAATVPSSETPEAIITPAAADLVFGDDYVGSDFGLTRQHVPAPLDMASALRAWMFHDAPATHEEERVVLWVRADLLR